MGGWNRNIYFSLATTHFGQSANWLTDFWQLAPWLPKLFNKILILRLPIEMLFASNCFQSANGIKQILMGMMTSSVWAFEL